MHKTLGASLLIAGTAIGSGMMALPIIMSKLGLIYSSILMLLMWLAMYYVALVNIELNLHAKAGLTLGQLGKKFSGPIAEWAGTLMLKSLTYALLVVFLYGGTSIFQSLIEGITGHVLESYAINFIYALTLLMILCFSVKFLDYLNRILFSSFLIILIYVILGLVSTIEFHTFPEPIEGGIFKISVLQNILPVVATAFGFQVILHSLTNYCELNPVTLKRSLFWGSLIPAVTYIIWTGSVMLVFYNNNPELYQTILEGNIDLGEMIMELSKISSWSSLRIVTWWLAIIAIITSAIGVALGLMQSWRQQLPIKNKNCNKLTAVSLTIIPPYIITLTIPGTFIKALNFAGMIHVAIAILLPIYLLYKIPQKGKFYPILRNPILNIISVLLGLTVIYFEILNLFF